MKLFTCSVKGCLSIIKWWYVLALPMFLLIRLPGLEQHPEAGGAIMIGLWGLITILFLLSHLLFCKNRIEFSADQLISIFIFLLLSWLIISGVINNTLLQTLTGSSWRADGWWLQILFFLLTLITAYWAGLWNKSFAEEVLFGWSRFFPWLALLVIIDTQKHAFNLGFFSQFWLGAPVYVAGVVLFIGLLALHFTFASKYRFWIVASLLLVALWSLQVFAPLLFAMFLILFFSLLKFFGSIKSLCSLKPGKFFLRSELFSNQALWMTKSIGNLPVNNFIPSEENLGRRCVFEHLQAKHLSSIKILIAIAFFLFSVGLIFSISYIFRRDIEASLFSPEGRVFIYSTLWQASINQPIFGWGWSMIEVAYVAQFPSFESLALPMLDKGHSVWFDWLVTTGFPGLILYLGFVILVMRKAFSNWLTEKKNLRSHEFLLLLCLFLILILASFNVVSVVLEWFWWVMIGFIMVDRKKMGEIGQEN